jgi:hypothetical protein
MIFQQDGAPRPSHLEVRQFLDEQLPGRRIGREGPISWLPRSPDLTPLDFFFWGYVKEDIYVTPLPRTVKELKEGISETITSVDADMLRGTWQEFSYRLDFCRVTRGTHIEHL